MNWWYWHLTSHLHQSIPPIHLCSCLMKSNEFGWKFASKQTISSIWLIILTLFCILVLQLLTIVRKIRIHFMRKFCSYDFQCKPWCKNSFTTYCKCIGHMEQSFNIKMTKIVLRLSLRWKSIIKSILSNSLQSLGNTWDVELCLGVSFVCIIVCVCVCFFFSSLTYIKLLCRGQA